MQGLFRNPMADPGIIGVSTGGAAGAVLAIAIGANAAFPLALPAMAFAGAAGALALVYAVASAGGRLSMAALLLTGVAVSAFLAAVISAIVLYTEDQGAQRAMIFWLAGGLGRVALGGCSPVRSLCAGRRRGGRGLGPRPEPAHG